MALRVTVANLPKVGNRGEKVGNRGEKVGNRGDDVVTPVHRSGDLPERQRHGILNLQIIINVKHDDYKSMIKLQKEAIALAIQFLESPHNGF